MRDHSQHTMHQLHDILAEMYVYTVVPRLFTILGNCFLYVRQMPAAFGKKPTIEQRKVSCQSQIMCSRRIRLVELDTGGLKTANLLQCPQYARGFVSDSFRNWVEGLYSCNDEFFLFIILVATVRQLVARRLCSPCVESQSMSPRPLLSS